MATVKAFSCSTRQLAGLLLVGIISGFTSFLALQPTPLLYYFAPGLVFGIAITLFLPTLLGITIEKKHFAFIFFSAFSYFVAFVTWFGIVWSSAQYGDYSLAALYISGLVGSLLFLFAYGVFVSSFSFRSFLLLLFWGAFLSLFLYPALNSDSTQVNNISDFSLSWGYMIWQGGMALGLGLVTNKRLQNAVVTGLLVLLFGLCGLAVIRQGLVSGATQEQTEVNTYQQEVGGIVSPDFKLSASKFENEGIDVGLVLTNDYTTTLSFQQAFGIIRSSASAKGYTLISAAVGGSCIVGYEADSSRGILDVCQTSYKNGVRTFEIRLTNFDTQPEANTPSSFTCLGDCQK